MMTLRMFAVLFFSLLAAEAYSQSTQKIRIVHALPQLSASFANDSSLPQALGFWKQEGLDVEVLTSPGASAAMQLVAAKQADIGIVNAFSSMQARQRGAKVISYYTSLRGDIFGIALPVDGGLKTLADLKGKSLGVSSFASGGTPYARGLLASAGLDSAKDVALVEIGVGGRAAAALKSNQVQALSLWDEMYVRMKQAGIGLQPPIQDQRAKYLFASNLTVQEEDLKRLEAALIGVARGIAKAQVFSETNPEAAVRIHWRVYPQSAPREGVTDATVKQEAETLAVRAKIQSRNAVGTNRFGDVPLDQVKDVQTYFLATNQVEKSLDPGEYYTNDLIDRINAFDEAAIIRMAKEWKAQ
ncbi:MAG: ABC transporter substrate-binding protein [Hyphomicrobiales bacterium]|nr:ABC transporter substrate-binding protein [Hyphomicrobiales bacterium]